MATSEIASFGEFHFRLLSAIERMQALRTQYDEPFYASIERQLRAVQEWTAGGVRPAQENIDKLTFGMMASRSVHDTDSELAKELYGLAEALRCWPPSLPVWK
ncbi:MAG: immunity protein Tsi6 family protein [Myxococcales bacterium]